MPDMTPVPASHPLMQAWEAYKQSADFATAVNSPGLGSWWATFMAGWNAATQNASALHESINPASDAERNASLPGAGAMGVVIEYRDAIRRLQP